MPPDDRYPNPDLVLRHIVRNAAASAAAPDPPAAPDGDVSPAVYALRDELKRTQARLKHAEQALRAAGRVLQPYLPGNGRS
jgi:hypothetical protein